MAAFKYLMTRGHGKRGHVKGKTKAEWTITQQQLSAILDAVEKSREEFNSKWRRDYCLIGIAAALGLRIGETVILERRHFSDLLDSEEVRIPTLKNVPRVPFECPGCKCKCRLRQNRIGTIFQCRCGDKTIVPKPNRALDPNIPELDLPFIEEATIELITSYIQSLPPQQNFLFESKPTKHISKIYAARIFYTFVDKAGLSNKISFHSLRHHRATRIYSQTKSLIAVKDGMRHHSIEQASVYAKLDKDAKDEAKHKLEKSSKVKFVKFGKDNA